MGEVPAEATLRGQHLEDVVLEQPREPLRVQRVEGLKLDRTREYRPAGIPPSIVSGTGRGQFLEDVSSGRSQVVPSPEQNVRAAQICERSLGPIGRKRIQHVSPARPPPDHHQATLQVAPSPTSTKPAQ